MGMLIQGAWRDAPLVARTTGGAFVRPESAFRDAVAKAEPGRYRLYVSKSCPWAHRTLIVRALKGLEKAVPTFYAAPGMFENGWEFESGGIRYLYQLYAKAQPGYTGRVTVPVLWDTKTGQIVSNESSEIIRMFNTAFNELTGNTDDYYPEDLRAEIDTINARVYDDINNGVYKAGFATTQEAYDGAVTKLFAALDWVEGLLGETPYLTGDSVTEADWRLFTTLVRFDAVYVGHFKCNRQRIADYKNISHYLKALYEVPGVKETVDLGHITTHYYWSHVTINPTRIIPIGPELPFLQ